MRIASNIALQFRPDTQSRRALAARLTEIATRVALRAARRPFHPAFGNGDTPHYGL